MNVVRFALVTPSARSRPDFICAVTEGRLTITICTFPAMRSVSAGAMPLCGMCTTSIFAADFNTSIAM